MIPARPCPAGASAEIRGPVRGRENQRMSLADAIMIKENHLQVIRLARAIGSAVCDA